MCYVVRYTLIGTTIHCAAIYNVTLVEIVG